VLLGRVCDYAGCVTGHQAGCVTRQAV
jgi:hypothetical protein